MLILNLKSPRYHLSQKHNYQRAACFSKNEIVGVLLIIYVCCNCIVLPLSTSGFGFVSFADNADSERAVMELNGKELDSRIIRVEKARRASGYEKTPGRCKINTKPLLCSINCNALTLKNLHPQI